MAPHHHTGSTVIAAAARAFNLEETSVTACAFSTPGLELQGRGCNHLVALFACRRTSFSAHVVIAEEMSVSYAISGR